MNKKKIIATASAVALAAMMAFGGTLAYYQGSAPEAVANTLVDQGNSVSISESDTDGDGSTQSNTYSIIPGTTDKKDPVVTAEYTLDSYVYVTADDTTKGWIKWAIANGWTELGEGYDGVYYMLLKTIQYDETRWENYSYTDSATSLTYSYDSTSATYTVANSSETTLYTYTVETNDNRIEVYTASIPVILNDTVTYSSEITNDTFEGYGSTVSLDFTAYIIQASLNDGTDEDDDYGEKEYSSAQLAYYYVNSEDYYEAAVENGNVAAINETIYNTLSEAVTAASESETVTLLVDIDENTTVEGNTTIDLNGHYVSGLDLSGDITLKDSGNCQTGTLLYSNSNLNLIIESGYYTGMTRKTSDYSYSSLVVNGGTIDSLTASNCGTTTINDGTINYLTATGKTSRQMATVIINGGNFPGGGNTNKVGNTDYSKYSIYCGSYVTLSINGGIFEKEVRLGNTNGNNITLNITGGTFKETVTALSGATVNITGGTFKNDPSSYVDSSNYTVTSNSDGTYTVTAGSASD